MQYDVVLVIVLITFAKVESARTRKYESPDIADLRTESNDKNDNEKKQNETNFHIEMLMNNELPSHDIDARHKIVTENRHHNIKRELVNINEESTQEKVKEMGKKAREWLFSEKNDISFNKESHSVKKRSETNVDICTKLNERYRKRNMKPNKMVLAVWGKVKKIYVNSTERATSKALAALLIAAIRYKAGYEAVLHGINNSTISELANSILPLSRDRDMDDTIFHIHVDADWDEMVGSHSLLPHCTPLAYQCGLAGTRLTEIGKAPSINLRVYAALSDDSLENCNFNSGYFNDTVFENCGFDITEQNNSLTSPCIAVLITPDVETTLVSESEIFGNNINFCSTTSTTREILKSRLERNITSSFIFVDYELDYEKIYKKRVRIIPTSLQLQEPKFAMQLADIYLFRIYAPYVVNILDSMRPQANVLREILELNENHTNIQDSACAWAYEHEKHFENLADITPVKLHFIFILCNDSEEEHLKNFIIKVLVNKLSTKLYKQINELNFNLAIETCDCRDKKILFEKISELTSHSTWKDTAGLAVPGSAIDTINIGIDNVQVVSYDIPPSNSTKNPLSKVSGDLQNLVLAIVHFFKKHGWSRIAIISEVSSFARSFTAELGRHVKQYRDEILHSTNLTNIRDILTKYRKDNAKIFFLNTGPEAANTIACEAANLGMTGVNEYAWIAREWGPHENNKCAVQVFTVSYWWHGNISLPNGESNDILKVLYEGYTDESWPILAAPMATALQLMLFRTELMLRQNSSRFFDLHLKEPFSKYDEHLSNFSGVVQKLERRNDMQLNPFVFVSVWREVKVYPIAVWQIQSETHDIVEINPIYEPYDGGKRPKDDKSLCLTPTIGDDFYPTCLDSIWISVLALLLVVPCVAWRVHRFRKIKQEKKKRLILMRLLSRCKRTAALLEPYLIDRSQLELSEELGSGHFGRVRFGMLRGRARNPTPVAAKTIREDATPAEEAEFLREACTMATLSHDHIVGVVGVCTDTDGPPLLLMDHAFFGDLLKYLRKRRHLVEVNERDSYISVGEVINDTDSHKPSDPEALYVTPPQLTRLGREAAEALAYLASHHILHRDVRAANCLIDARRILKLADFGMARNVEQKNGSPPEEPEDDDYKYICRRRGVFPVSWMAPESLDKGEFTRASDVWALGVLMLEISTLGARPYGSWKPLEVLRYVQSGGRPPLPRDATYHMLEVTEMCWNEVPSKRATAKEISEYLFLHPMALRGALRPAWPVPDLVVPDSSDSGWSSERDPDHDWSKDVDLRVSTL